MAVAAASVPVAVPEEVDESESADDDDESLSPVLVAADAEDDKLLSAPEMEAAVGVAVTPPHAVSKDEYRLPRALAALASSSEYWAMSASPESEDWAAASRPLSCVCTLLTAVCRAV